jgi:hypothetical protein
MTVQDFLTINPETLNAVDLAAIAEAYLMDWTPRQHEWHQYFTGSAETYTDCQEQYWAKLRTLAERRSNPPWSKMRMIWFHSKVISVGLGRILRRHLVRMAFEDYLECQRLVKKWMG